jgi:hypothetical protein
MMDLESVSLRVFQELAALALELGEEHLPVRGLPVDPEMEALGARVAREWLRTGQRPSLLAERVALMEGWQAAGKAQWEAPKQESPWGG